MRFEETEAQRWTLKMLAEYRNHVIDWCVGTIIGYNHVSRDLSQEQLVRITELLQREKTT